MERGGCIYIMANKSNTTLYIGFMGKRRTTTVKMTN
jgi:hypothetical protein